MAESSGSSSSRANGDHIEMRERPQHRYNYGGNPLAHVDTADSYESARLPAFGGAYQPGLYKPPPFNFGNPAPLGLAGFALTTFLLSCINLQVRGITEPSIVIAPALAYGGLIQLLAGMWEIALGNTFGGWALSSYGGFWMGTAIILIPGGFEIAESYSGTDFDTAFGLYIFAWFIFTFIVWLMTLKSTVAFSSLFLTVWLAFIFLGAGYLDARNQPDKMPNATLIKAGGGFGIIAAFIAWYNMLAGLADPSNSLFLIPVLHFPWSEKGREARKKPRDDDRENMV